MDGSLDTSEIANRIFHQKTHAIPLMQPRGFAILSATVLGALPHPDCSKQLASGPRETPLAAGGLTLPRLLRAESQQRPTSSDWSVTTLWMRGGPSHIDLWDPKPDAPAQFRGEFGTISTSIPGIPLTDMLPKSAARMHMWSIIRSLNHHDAGRSAGDQVCFTGYHSGPKPDENVRPSCGSCVSAQLGHLDPELPAYVMIPRMVPGTGSAYLGVAHKPFETQAAPLCESAISDSQLSAYRRVRRAPPR